MCIYLYNPNKLPTVALAKYNYKLPPLNYLFKCNRHSY